MNIRGAIANVGQILDEERICPTAVYGLVSPVLSSAAAVVMALRERGADRRSVQENPEEFVLRCTNFDLLCALLDQVPQPDSTG